MSLSFACRCSEQTSLECDETMAWACDFLKCKRADISTSVIHRLHWDYRARVETIGVDQWMGVNTKSFGKGEEFSTWVEGDTFEDIMALTLKVWHDKFGESRSE